MRKLTVAFGVIGTIAFSYFAMVSDGDEQLMMAVIVIMFASMTIYASTMEEI